MYVKVARRSQEIHRKLAEHKARLLILGCSEIAKTWPACGWILRLFETVFKNLQDRDRGNNNCVTQTTSHPSNMAGSDDQFPSQPAQNQAHGVNSCCLDSNSDSTQYSMLGQAASGTSAATTAAFQPDIQLPLFLDMPDIFDPQLLNDLSQDFNATANCAYPYF